MKKIVIKIDESSLLNKKDRKAEKAENSEKPEKPGKQPGKYANGKEKSGKPRFFLRWPTREKREKTKKTKKTKEVNTRENKEAEFSIKQLKQLLSDEKARILYALLKNERNEGKKNEAKGHEKRNEKDEKSKKHRNDKELLSIYALAKELGRDFKSVRKDLKLLEKFGFVNLIEDNQKRKRLIPVLALHKLQIDIEV